MLIQVSDIKKTYGTGEAAVHALKGVSFTIDKGEFVAIKGPSGSGKSTLLTILAGLSHPTGGEVITDEIHLYKELDSDGLAEFRNEYIGFVFQSFHLLPYLSAAENVMLPLVPQDLPGKTKKEKALEALDKVGLLEKARALPNQLSGGQCQRVAIARALVNDPVIVLADEPTGNLDTKTRDEILALFETIKKAGHTILMVSHDPVNVKQADKVIEIQDGLLAPALKHKKAAAV